MKISIISDIHDNLTNLNKFLKWASRHEIEAILCCGDVSNLETISILSSGFDGNIFLVQGNMELFEPEELKGFGNIHHGGRIQVWSFDGKKIGACHEPFLIDKVLTKEDCDLVFYGHTHKPWQESRGDVLIVNPGTLGGVFSKATFAFYDTSSSEPELKILERLEGLNGA